MTDRVCNLHPSGEQVPFDQIKKGDKFYLSDPSGQAVFPHYVVATADAKDGEIWVEFPKELDI